MEKRQLFCEHHTERSVTAVRGVLMLQQVTSFDSFVDEVQRFSEVTACRSGIITHVSEGLSASFGKKRTELMTSQQYVTPTKTLIFTWFIYLPLSLKGFLNTKFNVDRTAI